MNIRLLAIVTSPEKERREKQVKETSKMKNILKDPPTSSLQESWTAVDVGAKSGPIQL